MRGQLRGVYGRDSAVLVLRGGDCKTLDRLAHAEAAGAGMVVFVNNDDRCVFAAFVCVPRARICLYVLHVRCVLEAQGCERLVGFVVGWLPLLPVVRGSSSE